MAKFQERVFSGVQPTGTLHLGNYLGAIKNFVELQDKYNCVYCVVDQHAITVDQDPKELRSNILEVLASFIAAGVDYKKQIIFQQSSVPAHSQLAWVFNCVSRIGWLNRMTQFKDKAGKNRENVSVGLMVYPNLMAADILAYLATHVPVGDDQKQHLELSRDIAQKFNNDFGVEFFPQPEPLIYGSATRVMSLRDGNKKMSKSDPSDFSRILLTDDDDTISSKIKKAKSDSELIPNSKNDLQNKPECLNLINILSATTNQSADQVLGNYAGKEYSALK
jgi:tryptophanyl-tRNA synthetase